ncbi:tetratricopeptide repeat protein [Rhodopirellula sp. JC740]|uniref:Tetratricopeptide repeat protein n=1 Tax=Rhodopirellula halodulae TaxID=2894198 RepID=A0ABS8NIE2_9BACT|nr:tetratricopeptide repeat protein [Rhodopirellula sp. JC740]MCC9643338.1 tetratricopeptide repeat protein [Rhodopirellula sp. JC740]
MPPTLHHAYSLIQKGRYEDAVASLNSAGKSYEVRSALGVCLMRLGRSEAALGVFRQFVLDGNGITDREGVPEHCKRNFATALLMNGLAAGAWSVLSQLQERQNRRRLEMLSAIREWEKTLSWWRWIDWKLNRITASDVTIPLPFEPGELGFPVQGASVKSVDETAMLPKIAVSALSS